MAGGSATEASAPDQHADLGDADASWLRVARRGVLVLAALDRLGGGNRAHSAKVRGMKPQGRANVKHGQMAPSGKDRTRHREWME